VPFGGVDAIAVFRTDDTMSRIRACVRPQMLADGADARDVGPGSVGGSTHAEGQEPRASRHGRRVSLPERRNAPTLMPCAPGDTTDTTPGSRWSIYIQRIYPPLFWSAGASAEDGTGDDTGFAACLGCWPATKNPRCPSVKGSPMAWVLAPPSLLQTCSCASLYACSRACRNHTLFALSAADGPAPPSGRGSACMCADLPPPTRRRAGMAEFVPPPPVPYTCGDSIPLTIGHGTAVV